ncbi:hypothetical protein [Dysgonomonas sp. 511]|uniref:hypothetical protein n=1 Tax=Dysgonomonas sp. 511 TaxID=2302930 RepID=UPI0013D1C7F1|nr:hypothetical protein [Dysgonomonas sp. 511]NDV78976.1 hypothetical protein [Dysgonomonas sp. 511]
MAKTISNDAIWEKLSEIDEKLNNVLDKQQQDNVPVNIQPLSNDEVLASIKEYAFILGKSNDSHFEANLKNITTLNNNVLSIKKAVNNLSAPENINMNEIKALLGKKDIFRFGIIKFRKTSFIITIFGILIFILTVFSMKLYSDSLIYQNKYYREIITTQNLQIENDSLRTKTSVTPSTKTKPKKVDD